jgi:thiol-disulfide isomerase/thioredoxin
MAFMSIRWLVLAVALSITGAACAAADGGAATAGDIVAAGASGRAPGPELLKEGVQAPDLPTTDPSGKAVRVSDFKGKVVLLDFWATWCHACLQGFPRTDEMAKNYRDQGVVVVAVNTLEKRDQFDDWVKKNQAKYPDLIFVHDDAAGAHGPAMANAAAREQYGVSKLPTQFVVGRDGVIVGSSIGLRTNESKLQGLLAQAGIKTKPLAQVAEAGGNTGAEASVNMIHMMLEVTPEQKPRVDPILRKFAEEKGQIAANKALSADEKTAKLDALTAQMKQSLQPFLTDAQRTKLDHMRFQIRPPQQMPQG